jgi:hypothetical protein
MFVTVTKLHPLTQLCQCLVARLSLAAGRVWTQQWIGRDSEF